MGASQSLSDFLNRKKMILLGKFNTDLAGIIKQVKAKFSYYRDYKDMRDQAKSLSKKYEFSRQ